MTTLRKLSGWLVGQSKTTTTDQLVKRAQLRDRMGMIVTIDRAGTARGISNV
jgi:hypothetical protein